MIRISVAFRLLFVAFLAFLLGQHHVASAGPIQEVESGTAGNLVRIEPLVQAAIKRGEIPGAAIVIGRRDEIIYERCFGSREVEPKQLAMTMDTVFDLASLTKPIATATSVMMLIERGEIRLNDPVAQYLPEFGQKGKDKITIKQLLIHCGGLIPDNALADYEEGPEKAWTNICELGLRAAPGEKFMYTDVGFIVLAKLVEAKSGKRLDAFVQQNLFGPLGMKETGFLPGKDLQARSAPTEKRDGNWIRGEVHDPRAYRLEGVGGHAGVFSTAGDLAKYCQMMLGEGELNGERVLARRSVEVMTTAFDTPRGKRGLGWDIDSPYSSNRSDLYSESAFGHGGFTGTAIWIDPELDLFVIVLSSRLYPDGKGQVNRLASKIGSIAVGAVEPVRSLPSNRTADVRCGIDVLEESSFEKLIGKRVGLITNHTGLNREGVSTAKLLQDAKNVQLVRLFSPEHGLEGRLDVANIADGSDDATGLDVFSLYGKTKKPTPESLKGIDVLVFDIQDIGTRFYTYISTMGLAMEAAAEQDVEFMVLDRPNPLGGLTVEGPMLDDGAESFVAFHSLPIQHGMTVGELARLFVVERKPAPKLTVVPVTGWSRDQWWDQTGLVWVNPSPNMRSLNQAALYPGVGLLEMTNLSVGRGTDTPFEVFGAPWIDSRKLAAELNRRGMAGVRFIPIRFSPKSNKFAGQECGGINVVIADRAKLNSVAMGFEIARVLREQYPDDWDVKEFNRLLGNQNYFAAIVSGGKVSTAEARKFEQFKLRRKKALLYRR